VETEHRWTVRIGGGERDSAVAYLRKSRVEVGLPLTFDDEYPRVTALEYLLTAVAGDLVVGLKAHARKRRITIDNIEATAHLQLEDPLAHLGVVGDHGSPRIQGVSIKIYVDTLDDPERVEQAWREVLDRSPMIHTLSSVVELEHELAIT
jgi:uncharacterized OsmC-like protein